MPRISVPQEWELGSIKGLPNPNKVDIKFLNQKGVEAMIDHDGAVVMEKTPETNPEELEVLLNTMRFAFGEIIVEFI